MISKKIKLALIAFGFLIGFGVSEYRTSRIQLIDEINDYQREILIASRLLNEYTIHCASNKQSNFYPYVVHSISMYERLIKQSEKFPFYASDDFINDHEESIFAFQEKMNGLQNKMVLCEDT